MSLLIKNGRVIDPATKLDAVRDVVIENVATSSGRIAPAGSVPAQGHEVIDATGMLVLPGLIDLRAHLREPGQEYKEDLVSGTTAAVAGGITTVVAQPDTKPVIDNGEIVDFVRRRGEAAGLAKVLVAGAITAGLKGEQLAFIGEMRRAGAVILSDGDTWIRDAGLMRRALEYASDFGLTVMTHAEDPTLRPNGLMHEGPMSVRLGLKGIPSVAEETAIARDLALAAYTGARLHVAHVSSAEAVEQIRIAKKRGTKVTCDVAVHHLVLTDEALTNFNTSLRLAPPLRREKDREALIAGLVDGTIDAVASDHAPQSVLEKDLPFTEAEPGAIALQQLLPLCLQLVAEKRIDLPTLVARLTTGPAHVLGPYAQGAGAVAAGDLTVVAPDAEWLLARETLLSKCMNTPFVGSTLRGRVECTVVRGRVVYKRQTS
jgi:dihydroorotase